MNLTQGRVLHVVLSGLLLWFVSHGYCSAEHHSADQKPSTPSWKALREKAAHRRRRIIMNNDGNDVRGLPKDVPRTRETFLRQRTSPLVGSHVDTICYCTGAPFNMYRHHSQESELYRNSGDELDWGWELGQDGPDVLETMIDFGRQHGLEIFWSMRMNDSHDAKYAWCMSQWKKDHPDFLMGKPGQEFPFGRARWKGRWSALDYSIPEVREKTFRILQDVATRYDVDGLELDFFRHPVFFRPQMTGQPVTQQQCDLMTDLVRRVREMADDVGQLRGRPVLISVRIPDAAGYAKAIGLDVERWLRDDLIDLLVGGGYFHLQKWEQLVALGHRYDVPVYPCLSASRLGFASAKADPFNNRKVSGPQVWRGEAARAWKAGADGVYVFNCFNPNERIFHELGDPKVLDKLEKDYEVNVGHLDRWLKDGERFVQH
ncbi:MAG: family 10 glycosylhydrolase [Pirellulaceae bacterium]|nr:family 10 glycosylhydrolase [Pirellulaceae bacterium]